MITLLRKIRKNMLNQSKISKYLLYAIGEIALVIIGILIAVSINNWNEARKQKAEEQSILKDLKEEMLINKNALQNAIDKNKDSYEAALNIKDLFTNKIARDTLTQKEFFALLAKMDYNVTYDPQNGILNSLISSGKLGIINDKELRYALASLKEFTNDALEDTRKIEAQRDELTRSVYQSMWKVEDNMIKGYQGHLPVLWNPDLWSLSKGLFGVIRQNGLEEERALLLKLEYIIELIDKNIEQ
jgi:hypothetical protein